MSYSWQKNGIASQWPEPVVPILAPYIIDRIIRIYQISNTTMEKNQVARWAGLISFLLFFTTTMAGCAAIGDIFKAGAAVGIIVVVVIIGAILLVMSMFKK